MSPEWEESVRLWVKRDDLIHPVISGNKARKLSLELSQWNIEQPSHVASMGGNRSNFLHALSFVCFSYSIPFTAFIRGHEPQDYGPTLTDMVSWNTNLQFINKAAFRNLREEPGATGLVPEDAIWIPEGGSSVSALEGVIQSVFELDKEPDYIFVPVGTGCTALGIALGILEKQWKSKVIGVVVLKGAEDIESSLLSLVKESGRDWPGNLVLEHRFCDKGFGKLSRDVINDLSYFESLWSVKFEPVYSAKMCNAFRAYCREGLMANKQVILWHTGGLQGNR